MKLSKPLISVIIPALNEENNISDCHSSLTSQKTTIPYEIILVDNNSEDNTFKIAKSFSVKAVKETKRGRSYARQMGAMTAKGKYLAFTEADCEVPKDWIQAIYDFYNQNPQIIGFSGSYTFKNSSFIMQKMAPFNLALSSMLYKLVTGNHTFRGTNFTVQKKYLLQAGGFNHLAVPFDDVELGLRAGKLGTIKFNPEIKVLTSDRRIKKRLFTFFLEFIRAYSRIFIFKQKGYDLLYENIRN